MTNERIEAISQALLADKAKISSLFEMSPENAAAKLCESGYDFTAEELVEYGNLLEAAKKDAENNTELDENALENVAGGGLVTTALIGIAVGYWLYGQKW